jgi:hypothetical protein
VDLEIMQNAVDGVLSVCCIQYMLYTAYSAFGVSF